MRRIGIAAALTVACSSQAGLPAEEPVSVKTPPPPSSGWSDGPAVQPEDELLQWLQSEGEEKLLQLPVVVELGPLGIAKAWVGAGPPDGLLLKLDDSALGEPLASQLQALCGADPICAVWLQGRWGTQVEGMNLGAPILSNALSLGPTQHPFTIHKVVARVAPDDAQRVRLINP